VEETLSDTIRWYQQNGWLKTPELNKIPLRDSAPEVSKTGGAKRLILGARE